MYPVLPEYKKEKPGDEDAVKPEKDHVDVHML
jgi:hypothetical protein